VDGDGKFHGAGEPDDEAAMIIEPQADGKWAIKSKKYGWDTGGLGEDRTAFVKEITPDRLWTIHLAMHPHINLKNTMRKAYVHLDGTSFSTDEIVPWGDDATVTLHFNDENGTYSLVTCEGQFLTNAGALAASNSEASHFILEFQGGQVPFKAKATGKYITALGARGTLKASKSSITKDEQFVMDDSFPQITLKSANGKLVSSKGGIELSANATVMTDSEIYQLEPTGNDDANARSAGFTIKTSVPKYWTLDGSSVQAVGTNAADGKAFAIKWRGAKVAIKASNGKYVIQLMNAQLHTKADEATEENNGLYTYEIVNPPQLVLRGEFGFVGTLPSGLLECNNSRPEIYTMEITNGKVNITHKVSGKYWVVGQNGVSCTGNSGEDYALEIYDNSMLCLKSSDKYFEGAQNGACTVTGSKAGKTAFFEY